MSPSPPLEARRPGEGRPPAHVLLRLCGIPLSGPLPMVSQGLRWGLPDSVEWPSPPSLLTCALLPSSAS